MVTHTKMGILQRWLKRQALVSVTQPVSQPVISNAASYAANAGYTKLGWRHFRRAVVFALSGQRSRLCTRIEPGWKRGLWLYKGIPQIGDSLMDLAPRSLLQQQGLRIDLYTDPHLAALYQGDPWFHGVFDDPKKINSGDYDFVIVPSHKNRSLRDKARLLRKLPWVSMHGFYTGPDFHRARFATQRLMDLLCRTPGSGEFDRHESQKLAPLMRVAIPPDQPLKVALALGGVNAPRTYRHWPQLAKTLAGQVGRMEVTLLGSANATAWAKSFESECAGMFPIHNRVDQTSLTECRALINKQDLVIAADGGLMHLGTTTGTPMVSLFNGEISPLWQLSQPHLQFALQSETVDVNDIPMPAILDQVHQALAAYPRRADAQTD